MAWVWIIAVTAVAGACGAWMLARGLDRRSAALRAEVERLTSTAAAVRGEFERIGTAPVGGVGDDVATA